MPPAHHFRRYPIPIMQPKLTRAEADGVIAGLAEWLILMRRQGFVFVRIDAGPMRCAVVVRGDRSTRHDIR